MRCAVPDVVLEIGDVIGPRSFLHGQSRFRPRFRAGLWAGRAGCCRGRAGDSEQSRAFHLFGTNSYIVGSSSVAVIDPGPEDEVHYQALMAALGGRAVTHIFVSHTHRDHSPLAKRLQAATGR